MSKLLHHGPCPRCGSSDGLATYADGKTYCFSAKHDEATHGRRWTRTDTPDKEDTIPLFTLEDIATLPIAALETRGITEDIARRYGVRVEYDEASGREAAYYFPLCRGGSLVGYQKKAAKPPGERERGDVTRIGETKGADPFGANVAGDKGKFIIVTEGAEDCLAAAQMLQQAGKNYRVVATLGTEGWKRQLQFFHGYDKVVVCYDKDEGGRKAAAEFLAALRPGTGFTMEWEGDESDPNALLLAGRGADFFDALNRARAYQPAGILTGEAVWTRMENYVEPKSVPYPEQFVILQDKMGGIREAEITMLTGGSSVGKTAYTRVIKAHLLQNTDWRIGEVELEEQGEKTWRGVMEAVLGQRWKDASKEERRWAWEQTYGTHRIHTLDHRSQFGRGQSLVGKFKYLHYGLGCNAIFLDHVTLAVNEFGDGIGNPAQDQMMNEFLEFVETTGCHLFLLSHLRKSPGASLSFEEGAIPTMDDLKGSGSLKQVSFNIIGVSRNLQHDDEYERNVSQLHVMKCRETGRTGKADRLYWDDETRALVPAKPQQKEDDGEI